MSYINWNDPFGLKPERILDEPIEDFSEIMKRNRPHIYDGETEETQQMLTGKSAPIELALSNPWLHSRLYPVTQLSPEEKALERTNRVYSNYKDAKDASKNPIDYALTQVRKTVRNLHDNGYDWMKSGISNCTLTATQWIDPNNPVRNAKSIHNSPQKYGYTPIDSVDVVPGNILIARNPNNGSYHTMMVSGFANNDGTYNFDGKEFPTKKGEPLLTYSRGGHHADAIRRNIPLSVYTANSDGHTENLFYRYNYPNEVFLPEVIIKGRK